MKHESGYGPEEDFAHWRSAKVTADLEYNGRRLYVRRLPDDADKTLSHAFARCEVLADERPAGSFDLEDNNGSRALSGYLLKKESLKETDRYSTYMVRRHQMSPDDDWPALLTFVKQMIDYNYEFPKSLAVELKSFEVPKQT